MGVFGRLRESLARTKQQIADRFDEIVRLADEPEKRSRTVDVETVEALEELLISADLGVAAADRIVAHLHQCRPDLVVEDLGLVRRQVR